MQTGTREVLFYIFVLILSRHETAAIAKSVGGIWTKVTTKEKAIQVYRDAYTRGYCKRLHV